MVPMQFGKKGSLGGLSYLAWVVTAYLIAATVAAPLYGRMGDARSVACALALCIARTSSRCISLDFHLKSRRVLDSS